jgi:mono/diheme cytochrome c family protein
MKPVSRNLAVAALSILLGGAAFSAYAAAGHSDGDTGHNDTADMMETMREQHMAHEHGHDFEAMDLLSPDELGRMIVLMQDVGLVVPPMDAARGRELFVETGCVACHSVNGIGGEIGPSLNAADMPSPMNTFEFAARMWRGAEAMTMMQQDMLGETISLTGQDLADLVAFAHDEEEQQKLTENQIPEHFRKLIDE